jgi:Rrf2 family nitric oxide-sensitive transcriptional repressor
MISQTAEYALRAVVFLGERPQERHTTRTIAEHAQVPAGYLAKVMQSLAQAGVVRGQRGLNGGFSLARAPRDISLSEVVEAIDPIRRIHKCPLNLEAHREELCPLHSRLDKALARIEKEFRESTVEDLLVRPTFRPAPFGEDS